MSQFGNTPLGSSLGGNTRSSGKSAKFKILVTSAVILPLSLMSMVLANSITINQNQGGSIEFGQGAANTSVCEANMTTEMTSSYDLTTDQFILNSVIVSGQAAPDNLGQVCAGRVITVIPVYTRSPAAFLATMRATPSSTDETTYTLTPDPGVTVVAENVDRILIQTE